MYQLSKVIILLVVILSWSSCQNTPAKSANSASTETPAKTNKKISMTDLKNADKDGTTPTMITDEARAALEKLRPSPEEVKRRVANNRDHAHSLVDSRSKKEKAYAMMTAKPLLYRFVFNGKEMSKVGDYDGHWIQFNDDFTYNKGIYENETSTGRWHLTLESMKLIIVDSEESKMPQEFKIMAKDDTVIFQGSDYFGNNPLQMKLEKGPIPKTPVQ